MAIFASRAISAVAELFVELRCQKQQRTASNIRMGWFLRVNDEFIFTYIIIPWLHVK